jgi:hypothetical protein
MNSVKLRDFVNEKMPTNVNQSPNEKTSQEKNTISLIASTTIDPVCKLFSQLILS